MSCMKMDRGSSQVVPPPTTISGPQQTSNDESQTSNSPELNSIISSDSTTGYLPPIVTPTANTKPYGDSIGFALDVIVVQPSSSLSSSTTAEDDNECEGKSLDSGLHHSLSNAAEERTTTNSDSAESSFIDKPTQQPQGTTKQPRGIIASSDFTVHFPDRSHLISAKNYVIQIQINGRLLKESFLSMKLPESSNETKDHGSTHCAFSQGRSAKPPTKVLQELVCKGLLNPGRNLIRYILIWRGKPVKRNSNSKRNKLRRNGGKNDHIETEDALVRAPIGFADAHIYLWSVHDTVIVSDIDGTVTKSDIRGVISTVVTKKYTHVHDGVCAFFSNLLLHANDATFESVTKSADEDDTHDTLASSKSTKDGKVRVLYLSSRALRLINSTRNFLNLVQQSDSGGSKPSSRYPMNDTSLTGMPPGPIFMSKGTIASVLKMELVQKTAHEFKADVLARQVILPFVAAGKQSVSTLFNAGFGNKHTDAMAYEMVGIDKSSIYIINPRSLLVSTHVDLEDNDNENNEEKDQLNSMNIDCGVLELLDPTISLFRQKSDGGPMSPTNISLKSPQDATLSNVCKKRTYEGYSDPLLTTALHHKIRRDRVF